MPAIRGILQVIKLQFSFLHKIYCINKYYCLDILHLYQKPTADPKSHLNYLVQHLVAVMAIVENTSSIKAGSWQVFQSLRHNMYPVHHTQTLSFTTSEF